MGSIPPSGPKGYFLLNARRPPTARIPSFHEGLLSTSRIKERYAAGEPAREANVMNQALYRSAQQDRPQRDGTLWSLRLSFAMKTDNLNRSFAK